MAVPRVYSVVYQPPLCVELSSAFSSFFGGSEGKEEPGADAEDAVESPSETTPTDTPTSETDRTDESDSDETTPTGDEEERTRDREEVYY